MTTYNQFKVDVHPGMNDLSRPGNASEFTAHHNDLMDTANDYEARINALEPPALYMPFIGLEGSTDFASSSVGGHTYTSSGTGVKIVEGQGRHGSSCLQVNDPDQLIVTPHAWWALDLQGSAFTIEFWLKLNQSLSNALIRWVDDGGSGFMINQHGMYCYNNNSFGGHVGWGTGLNTSVNKWMHHALAYENGTHRYFLNGSLIQTTVKQVYFSTQGEIKIGGTGVDCLIDDFSIVKSCKYKKDFVIS